MSIQATPFIDEVEIDCQAGNGGDGMVHFRREALVPRGGPDGGDGGKGGDIILQATTHLNTLNEFRYRRRLKSASGKNGGTNCATGASGDDLVVLVPMGTMVYDAKTNQLLGDLQEHQQTLIIAHGGKGGLGNWHFRSAVNRAPRKATPGKDGEHRQLRLELRLLADVGLVGLPNAGKSSLIRTLTAARPKVGDYPFTTLVPNLGVVEDPFGGGFVIADVPGLIEGAAQGAGLGHAFLRHLARNRFLILVCDVGEGSPTDVLDAIRVIEKELANAPVSVDAKIEFLALNKVDLLAQETRLTLKKELSNVLSYDIILTSTITGEGIAELKKKLATSIKERRKEQLEAGD